MTITHSALVAIMLAAAAGCSGPRAIADTKDTKSAPLPGPAATADPPAARPPVEVVRPIRKPLVHTTTQPATFHPYFQADIVARVSGYVGEIKVDIGDSVVGGQPLCSLQIPEMVQQREQAVARQRRLQAELQRAEAAREVTVAQTEAAVAEVEEAISRVKQFEARLVADRADLERMTGLVEKQAATIAMLDEARADHDVSEASRIAAEAAVRSATARQQIAAAEQRAAAAEIATAAARLAESGTAIDEIDTMLNYATLRAPFDGVITSRSVDPGDFVPGNPAGVSEGQRPLFHVEQQRRLRIRVAIPERHAARVDAGDPVTIACDGLPGTPLQAAVSRVARRLDPSTRTMEAEIDVDNGELLLLPGMFGRATITTSVESEAVLLPAAAIRTDPEGGPFVLIVDEENRLEQIAVTLGADDGHAVQIRTGLSGNERVVAATVGPLQPGQQVAPLPQDQPNPASPAGRP